MRVNLDKYLLKVEKPAQYLGNEINSIHKDEYKARMCLFFPDNTSPRRRTCDKSTRHCPRIHVLSE